MTTALSGMHNFSQSSRPQFPYKENNFARSINCEKRLIPAFLTFLMKRSVV